MINMLTFEVDYLALTQSLCVLRLAVVLATCYTYYINQKQAGRLLWSWTSSVRLVRVMASTCLTWWSRVILTPVEEGAYDVMAVTEYVDYETEPDRYIREIEEAMQRLTVALKELKEYHAEYEWNIGGVGDSVAVDWCLCHRSLYQADSWHKKMNGDSLLFTVALSALQWFAYQGEGTAIQLRRAMTRPHAILNHLAWIIMTPLFGCFDERFWIIAEQKRSTAVYTSNKVWRPWFDFLIYWRCIDAS